MVMHARKLPRLNDGYSAKSGYDEMLVHTSPNGKSSYTRSISPDSRSQSPRYPSKSSYHRDGRLKDYRDHRDYRDRDRHRASESSPRDRERDRERDRDRDRDRYRDRDRDRDRDRERDRDSSRSYERSDRDRSEVRRDDRPSRVGSWTEHVSSSGKKYYYNSTTEVSQWDKPREWLDAERREYRESEPGSQRPAASLVPAATSTAGGPTAAAGDKSGYERVGGGGSARRDSSEARETGTPRDGASAGCGRSHRDRTEHRADRLRRRSDEPRTNGQAQQDMEISSGDSTPTEESACGGGGGLSEPAAPRLASLTAVSLSAALPRLVEAAPDGDTPPPAEDRGPPTPTLSEPVDTPDRRADLASPCSSISSLQQTSLAALRPAVPQLAPSHAQYFSENLIQHVVQWPATVMEKQANRTSDEACHLASLQMTKAATDLKMARSLVRQFEIQATLQEQRILFLRQQIQELDELKSQNSFMSDT